jgi:hypothetical protein
MQQQIPGTNQVSADMRTSTKNIVVIFVIILMHTRFSAVHVELVVSVLMYAHVSLKCEPSSGDRSFRTPQCLCVASRIVGTSYVADLCFPSVSTDLLVSVLAQTYVLLQCTSPFLCSAHPFDTLGYSYYS